MRQQIILAAAFAAFATGAASAAQKSCSAHLMAVHEGKALHIGTIAYKGKETSNPPATEIVACKAMMLQHQGRPFPQRKTCANGATFKLVKGLEGSRPDGFKTYKLDRLVCR